MTERKIETASVDPSRAWHMENGRPGAPGFLSATGIRQETGRWVVSFYGAHDVDRLAAVDVDDPADADRIARTVLDRLAVDGQQRAASTAPARDRRAQTAALVAQTIAAAGLQPIGGGR